MNSPCTSVQTNEHLATVVDMAKYFYY